MRKLKQSTERYHLEHGSIHGLEVKTKGDVVVQTLIIGDQIMGLIDVPENQSSEVYISRVDVKNKSTVNGLV